MTMPRYLGDRGKAPRFKVGKNEMHELRAKPDEPLYPERTGEWCEIVEETTAYHYPLIVRFKDGETGIARREDVQ